MAEGGVETVVDDLPGGGLLRRGRCSLIRAAGCVWLSECKQASSGLAWPLRASMSSLLDTHGHTFRGRSASKVSRPGGCSGGEGGEGVVGGGEGGGGK